MISREAQIEIAVERLHRRAEGSDKVSKELEKCSVDSVYFIKSFVNILQGRKWALFDLFPAQIDLLGDLGKGNHTCILKARQLGVTWLLLAYILWVVLFRPVATILILSRREKEAIALLQTRLIKMHQKLPDFLKQEVLVQTKTEWELANGSMVIALPTGAGDSYTATIAFADEFDLVEDQSGFLESVKPTVDGGGQLVLVSRANSKREEESEFLATYLAGLLPESEWTSVFLGWDARPDRDEAWYSAISREIEQRTGNRDSVHSQYPSTPEEAISPPSSNRRIHPDWVDQCFRELKPLVCDFVLPGLRIYRLPEIGAKYFLGGDPSEGNPDSHPSSAVVLSEMGEEVALLTGRLQPGVFAENCDRLGTYYNSAALMIERNNHGHAVLLWLELNSKLRCALGRDDRPGWQNSVLGKSLIYSGLADACRNIELLLHSLSLVRQIKRILASTLRGPGGKGDDEADAVALARMALFLSFVRDESDSDVVSALVVPESVEDDEEGWERFWEGKGELVG